MVNFVQFDDYVIWSRYVDNDGNVVEQSESITFLTSLLSLFGPRNRFLTTPNGYDDDGDDDIQVGLSVNLNNIDLSGTTLSASPQLDYQVSVLPSSTTDSGWDNLCKPLRLVSSKRLHIQMAF